MNNQLKYKSAKMQRTDNQIKQLIKEDGQKSDGTEKIG